MQRIVIIGTTGAGKSTLADQLQARLNIPHVEIDGLAWSAGWKLASRPVLRERLAEVTSNPQWILSGNYRSYNDLTWAKADTLIWLDYPFGLIFYRLFKRTVRRIVTRENLWGNGIYESWRAQFLSRNSLFLWLVQTYGKNREEFLHDLQQPGNAHLTVIHHRSPRETQRWVDSTSFQKRC